MPEHILVANRGEIAIRVLRTAADCNIMSTAIHAIDDSCHCTPAMQTMLLISKKRAWLHISITTTSFV